MSLESRVTAALLRVGSTAALIGEDGSALNFPASVQPRMSLQPENAGPLGAGRPRRAELYAPSGDVAAQLRPGSELACDGIRYRVLQIETKSVSGSPLYIWAALEVMEEADP